MDLIFIFYYQLFISIDLYLIFIDSIINIHGHCFRKTLPIDLDLSVN